MRMTLTEKFFFRFTLSFFLFLVRVYVAFIEWERMTCVFSLFFSFVSLTVRRRGDDCAPFRVRVWRCLDACLSAADRRGASAGPFRFGRRIEKRALFRIRVCFRSFLGAVKVDGSVCVRVCH